jgi:hypothetical protein
VDTGSREENAINQKPEILGIGFGIPREPINDSPAPAGSMALFIACSALCAAAKISRSRDDLARLRI